MTPSDFEYLCKFLKQRSGIVITDAKRYLVESRLGPIAEKNGLDSLEKLVPALRNPGNRVLIDQVIDAMTTNESFFFRDKTPFENFRNVMLPKLLESRSAKRQLRIWSAAASTGQEAYSLAMEIREMQAKLAGWRIEIIGTDLSNESIAKAKKGLYTQFEVQRGTPTSMLVKYFKQDEGGWSVDPALKAMVRFSTSNLLDNLASHGQFDIVFCRNVLIYFDRETKVDILKRISKQMPEDGFLVLGAAETVIGLSDAYEPVAAARGLYQRKSTGTASRRRVVTPAVSRPGLTSLTPSDAAALRAAKPKTTPRPAFEPSTRRQPSALSSRRD